jgi:hypothetical protein
MSTYRSLGACQGPVKLTEARERITAINQRIVASMASLQSLAAASPAQSQ